MLAGETERPRASEEADSLLSYSACQPPIDAALRWGAAAGGLAQALANDLRCSWPTSTGNLDSGRREGVDLFNSLQKSRNLGKVVVATATVAGTPTAS